MSFWADHPLLGGLFGDAGLSEMLSPSLQLAHMRNFESSLLRARAHAGQIPYDQAERIIAATSKVDIDIAALQHATRYDGVVVPGLVAQLRQALPAEDAAVFHTKLTSQDVIDSSFAMLLSPILSELLDRIEKLDIALEELGRAHGPNQLMGRTRHQAALPITAQHRIDAWRGPFAQLKIDLTNLRPLLLRMQLGGPVGLADGLGPEIAAFMAKDLGLTAPTDPWHTDRHAMVAFGGWLSQVSGALGKIGQDIALMAQQGIDDIRLTGGGNSSAMPHKQNPILAETLVTHARYNSMHVSGLHQALIHEQERSGIAWGLEWMILPQMIETTGAGLAHGHSLIRAIEGIGEI